MTCGDRVTATVETLAYGGDGIARIDGRVIFIPETIPGETVSIRISQVKKRYARAELLELIALHGKERLYNVASGEATTHGALAEKLFTAGYTVDFAESGKTRALPAINIGRIEQEFGRAPRSIINDLTDLVK